MRISIAALPGANEQIIPAEDVLLKARSSCLTAAFNEITISFLNLLRPTGLHDAPPV